MKPRAIIAEDEPVLRAGLKNLLAAVWPDLEIIGVAEVSGAEVSGRIGSTLCRVEQRRGREVTCVDIAIKALVNVSMGQAIGDGASETGGEGGSKTWADES